MDFTHFTRKAVRETHKFNGKGSSLTFFNEKSKEALVSIEMLDMYEITE